MKEKKNNTSLWMVIKYFIRKSMKYKCLVLLTITWMILIWIVWIASPIYLTKFVDIFATTWTEKSELIKTSLKILAIVMALDLVNIAARRMVWFPAIKFELWVTKDIYEECFQYIHNHSYRFFTNNLSWSLIKKITKLAWAYEDVADTFIFQIMRIIIFIPLAIIVLFKENWLLWIIFVIFIILYVSLQIYFFNISKKYEIASNERDSKATWELSDTIINSYNITIFSSLVYEFKRFSKTLWESVKYKGKKRKMSERSFTASWILTWIFSLWALYISIKARWNWIIQASVVILVQMYLVKITDYLSYVRYILKSMSKTLWESTEMLEILNTPHEIIDYTDKKLKIKSWRIEFEDVTFSYDWINSVFENLNLKIKPWEKVAIVWASWSWKTTLTKLLFRFFNIQWWKILIDWEDISQVTQESLREQLSIVPQDPILFHRTIKENIAYWRMSATEEEIIAASKMAKCHEFISKLKDWYNSYVWERGVKLSWWERQRIAIARAILENKKVLVMDEATSSLDSESEKYIQNAMDEVMKNKTCIVIAHRLSTIVKMDRIIVMDQGKIIENWSHNELINKKDWVYKKLWSIQSWWFLINENDKKNAENDDEEEEVE